MVVGDRIRGRGRRAAVDRSEPRSSTRWRGSTPFGTTGLHDAIIRSIDAIQAAKGRRALVLLSDGDDRYSKATAADALDRARRSDVMVYPDRARRARVPPLFAELAVADRRPLVPRARPREADRDAAHDRPRAAPAVPARLHAVAADRAGQQRVAVDHRAVKRPGVQRPRARRVSGEMTRANR